MKKLDLTPKDFYLVTVHRAENTDTKDNLKKLCRVLASLDRKTVFPVHPRTRKKLSEFKLLKRLLSLKHLLPIDPVSYLDMLVLEKNAKYVLTDSGGVQKEAFFLRTPCLTMRKETEWVETLAGGNNIMVGLDVTKMTKAIQGDKVLLRKAKGRTTLPRKGASKKIAQIITSCKIR